MKSSNIGLTLVALATLLSALSIYRLAPPAAVPEDAPADQFSALRAWQHLEVIAREPHPIGSAEHRRVRQYIVGELTAQGLEPQLQTTTSVARRQRIIWPTAGTVTNVMARLHGRESGKAVLLMSHYDTVPNSSGAADDSAGVAAMLETLRALKQGPALRNDVIFLFTDGEEPGLLGASAFIEQHPWASDVAMVLNFEGRGTEGPSLMFQTSPGNGRLIRTFSQATDHPMGSSLSEEVYKRLPNSTDFTPFLRAGMTGYNFAFIHGETTYHTAQDNLDRLDPRSLQHHGDYALGLTRHLADTDLGSEWRTGDAVYFNLLGSLMIIYPGTWVLPLMGLMALATVTLLLAGFRRGRLSIGGLSLSLIVNLLGGILVGGLLHFAGSALIGWRYDFSLWNGWSSRSLSLLALALIATALTLLIFNLARRWITAGNLIAGGLLAWLFLALSLSLAIPGASYLATFSLLPGLLAAWRWFSERGDGGDAPLSWLLIMLLALTVGLPALIWPSTLALIAVAIGSQFAVVLGVIVFLLLFGLTAPLLELIRRGNGSWWLPTAAAVLGLALFAAGRLGSEHDTDNRRQNSVFYVVDTDQGKASWISTDLQTDAWTSQFFPDSVERSQAPPYLTITRPVLMTQAPLAPLGGAEIRLLDSETGTDSRTLEVNIAWPFELQRATFLMRSSGEIRSASVNGEDFDLGVNEGTGGMDERILRYYGPPPEGVHLRLEIGGDQPLEIEAVGQRYELPKLTGFSHRPRPAELMPFWGWHTDSTVIRNVRTLTAGEPADVREDTIGEETVEDSPETEASQS